MRAPSLARAALLAAVALCPSCIANKSLPGVTLHSTPAGAQVFIDGEDTGFVTPCAIALDEEEVHLIEVRMEGYETVRRRVHPGGTLDLVYFRDADRWPRYWPNPVLLPFEDVWFPVKRNDSLRPSRLHVRLRLAGEE